MSALTCDRCLDGRHRCLTAGCACTCRTTRKTTRPRAGGVLRTPRPSRAAWSTAPPPDPTIPGNVLALAEMLRRWQLTGSLE